MIFAVLAAVALGQYAAADKLDSVRQWCCVDTVICTTLGIKPQPLSQMFSCSSVWSDAFTAEAYDLFLDMERQGQPLLTAVENACLVETQLFNSREKADGSGSAYQEYNLLDAAFDFDDSILWNSWTLYENVYLARAKL